LTGDISEEKLFFAYGPPATGKSTFLSAVQAAIGEYAITTDFTSFLASRLRQGGPRSDIAGLSGYRLVSSIEVEDGQHMAEGVLSLLSGGDRISARFLHKEFFEFTPTFKIWLAANNRPDVSSGESALWRRLKLLPFDQVIKKPDPAVKKILSNPAKSGAAVMAWLVEGCLAWKKEGLQPEPDAVQALTNEYRRDSDPLGEFIRENCIVDITNLELHTGKQVLYDLYRTFCDSVKEKYPLGQKNFNKCLYAKGLRDTRIGVKKTIVWNGITISERHEPDTDK
jgi:putative DNA primase/helicase